MATPTPNPPPHIQQIRFDVDAGEALAIRGMDAALEAAPRHWRRAAHRWLEQQTGRFTADDLVAAIGLPNAIGINRNNVLGALFNAWAAAGLIVSTGTAKAQRPTSHRRSIRVWSKRNA